MGWKLKGRPKTIPVTKELAVRFSEMDPAPQDRPLSERRLMVYRRLLAKGEFRPVTWATARCVETGGTYRVNGKHTSVMLAGLETMPEFFVTVEEYACDTLEDVAKLYATFDSKMQSRSVTDINRSFAGSVTELKDMSSVVLNAAVAGMWTHLSGFKQRDGQAADRAELLLEYPHFVVWLHSIAGGMGSAARTGGTRYFKRAAVVAAMMATYLKDRSKATDFWERVRDETDPTPDTPARRLAKYLSSHGLSYRGGGRKMEASSSREQYVKCLHAWNAWRTGESTKLNYHPEKGLPEVK